MISLVRAAGLARNIAVLGCLITPVWAGQSASCRPTLHDFRVLKKGMTYGEVEKLFGCPGRRGAPVRFGRNTRVDYSWFGHGTFGANIHLTFMNGHLAAKSQLGLHR